MGHQQEQFENYGRLVTFLILVSLGCKVRGQTMYTNGQVAPYAPHPYPPPAPHYSYYIPAEYGHHAQQYSQPLNPNLAELVDLDDVREAAFKILNRNTRSFSNAKADDGITKMNNRIAFDRLVITPKDIGKDVSYRSLATKVLGKPVNVPFGVANSYFQKPFHSEGELATVKAVESARTIMCVSIFGTTTLEEIADAAPDARKWLEIIPFNRTIMEDWIRRAEDAYYEAIVIDLIPGFAPNRDTSRYSFHLDPYFKLANFDDTFAKILNTPVQGMSAMELLNDYINRDFSWSDLSWLVSATKLPVVLKGQVSPADVDIAISKGIRAIYLTNHGGRLVDTVPGVIEVLPSIAEAVNKRVDLYIDGSVTRGTDVLKALALGARFVFIGRPILYGLSVGGSQGVLTVLNILREELDHVMAVNGITYIDDIQPSLVHMSRNLCPQSSF